MKNKPLRIVEVSIDRLSKDGFGVGSSHLSDGKPIAVEVPFTMPGDQAKAKLLRKRSGIYASINDGITSPAPERIAARCIHFGECGGCRWQMIPYAKQLTIKESLVNSYFNHLLDNVAFNPIVPCATPWNYRNKMEFSFSRSTQMERFLGMIRQGSKGRAFHLKECHLVNPWFAKGVEATYEWWGESGLDAYFPPGNRGSLRTLTLREGMRTGDRLAYLTVSGNPDYALKKGQIDSWVAAMKQAVAPEEPQTLSLFLRIQHIAEGSKTQFFEMHLAGPDHIREELHLFPQAPLKFKISPTAFFQPNTLQAEKLYQLALEHAGISAEHVVYDLYCGTGTLGVCAAKTARQVFGIDIVPEATLDAVENARINGIENYVVFTGDVGKVLTDKAGEIPPPDVILVDPPRSGLDAAAVAHLIRLAAPTIVYVSCNPKTQAINVEELMKNGYRLESLQPVDQFPHTIHIENIAVLKRRQ